MMRNTATRDPTTRRRSVWIMTPFYICSLTFLFLLLLRLDNTYALSWSVVFIPLFISDVAKLVDGVYQTVGGFATHRKNDILCGIIDTSGLCLTKISIIHYMNNHTDDTIASSASVILIPLWLTSLTTMYLRCVHLFTPHTYERRYFTSTLAVLIFQFTLKIVQPLLIALQLDGFVRVDWGVIATPCWVILFFGLICGSVLIHISSSVHPNSLPIIRYQAIQLMLLCSIQVFVVTLCGLTSTIWIVERFNYLYGMDGGIDISWDQILIPLICIFIFLLLLYPLTIAQSHRYQELLYTSVEDAMRQGGLRQASETTTLLPHSSHTWLLHLSDSLFARTTPESLGFTSDTHLKTLYYRYCRSYGTEGNVLGDVNNISDEDIPLLQRDIEMRLQGLGDSHTEMENSLEYSPYIRQLYQELTPHSRENGVCYICYTAKPDACFMECGHGGLCLNCATVIARKRPHICPFCREHISEVLRLTGPSATLPRGDTITLSEEAYELRRSSNRVDIDNDFALTL